MEGNASDKVPKMGQTIGTHTGEDRNGYHKDNHRGRGVSAVCLWGWWREKHGVGDLIEFGCSESEISTSDTIKQETFA